ncbi:hypothetical protein D9M71_655960 [compost metagenome]
MTGLAPACRSELAREDLKGDALNQIARVIVDVLREQARSYRYTHKAVKKMKSSHRKKTADCASNRRKVRV